jgi:hypothetical protein
MTNTWRYALVVVLIISCTSQVKEQDSIFEGIYTTGEYLYLGQGGYHATGFTMFIYADNSFTLVGYSNIDGWENLDKIDTLMTGDIEPDEFDYNQSRFGNLDFRNLAWNLRLVKPEIFSVVFDSARVSEITLRFDLKYPEDRENCWSKPILYKASPEEWDFINTHFKELYQERVLRGTTSY